MTRSHKKTRSNDKYFCFVCGQKAPNKQSIIVMYDELIAFNCGLCHTKYSVTIMKEGPIHVYKIGRAEIKNMCEYKVNVVAPPIKDTIYNDI